MLENTEGVIKNEQSRELATSGTQDEEKQNKNTTQIFKSMTGKWNGQT